MFLEFTLIVPAVLLQLWSSIVTFPVVFYGCLVSLVHLRRCVCALFDPLYLSLVDLDHLLLSFDCDSPEPCNWLIVTVFIRCLIVVKCVTQIQSLV